MLDSRLRGNDRIDRNGATMKRCLLTALLMLMSIAGFAVTLNVAIDGSGQYTVIQDAIEVATNGDTVLVHPGRYIENIDYIGKSITVCSLEATTNDSTYITSTIIDGNRNGSCVAFRNAEQNASLRGFTLTNGSGFLTYDESTRGGGIMVYADCSVSLINCNIFGNYAGSGAGLSTLKCSVFLSGLKIHHNYAISHGGGISHVGASSHTPTIIYDPANRCSVFENYGAAPVDMSVIDIRADLTINLASITVNPPSTFYVGRHNNLSSLEQYHDIVFAIAGYREEVNHDIYVSHIGNDNNSGLSPGEAMKTITKAVHRIAADSLNVKSVFVMPGVYEEGANAQIYPIPVKSHTNIIGAGSGLVTLTSSIINTMGYPSYINSFKIKNSLIKGISMTEGVSSNRGGFKNASSQTGLRLSDIVISDMVSNKRGAFFIYELSYAEFDSLVVRNIVTPETGVELGRVFSCVISNSTFENIHSTYTSIETPGDDSWAMTVVRFRAEDSLTINNCTFRDISVQNNQSIFSIDNYLSTYDNVVDVVINGCLFEDIRTNDERGIFFGNNNLGSFKVSNCTFYNNYGSASAVGIWGKIAMRNNIFYNPDATEEICMYGYYPSSGIYSNLDFDYNNIRGGSASILNSDFLNTLVYGEHNLSDNPMFASTTIGNPNYLRLATGSPCINSGTPDTTGLSILPYDLAGNNRIWNDVIDMGCYEYGSVPYVGVDDPSIPSLAVYTLTAYPNPFQSFTNLKVDLSSYVSGSAKPIQNACVNVYNIKGQKVKSIELNPASKGEQLSYWDGRDANNTRCSSGVYILHLVVNGKQVSSRKVTLVR